ncbi:MAG: HlyD family efflux transporter periplasmic adaptor subunit, partial [Planctomycetota bacterium]
MTQSLTSAAADTPAPPVTTTSPARSRRRWSYAGAALAVLALAVVGFRAVEWARTTRVVTQADKFTVGPRSFSVVLKEKGELQAAKATEITCEVEGRSTIIYLVPEGTAVKKGDLLVELASDAIEDRIRQAELREANAVAAYEAAKAELDIQRDRNASDIRKAKLQIELAELELKKYAEGEWAQQLKDAQIAIDQARINLKRREEDYKSAQELYKRDFITKTQYQEDEFNYQKAKWDLEKALKAKEVLESYTHVAALRKRESDLEEAKKEAERVIKNAEALELQKQRNLEGKKKELDLIRAELAKYRAQREKCRITAPTQGFVVYYSGGGRHFMSNDTQIREGATVHERQVLMTLPDTSEMIVVVRVHEAKTDKLRLGQRAVVRVEGMPGKTFTGTVTKIAAVADTQNRWLNPDLKEYETHITLDPTDAQLKPGVTAYVQIEVETVENVLAVPVQSIYAKGGRRYVFRQNGDEPEPVPVKVGAIGTAWAEIREGLREGDRVL